MHLQYLFFDNLTINTESFSDISIKNSIFYNPETDFQIQTSRGTDVTIEHNIFLRDVAHTKAVSGNARWNRSIYIGGYSTSSKYEHQTNTSINENLFGAKLNELDALKSIHKVPELTETIELLQTALQENDQIKNSLQSNEQNNFTTFVNSYSTLKKATFIKNIFYSNRDNQDTGGIEQDHVVYLRGAQDIVFAGNHIRGSQNGTAGGLKFKSGRNVSVLNNYFRNSGLILYDTAEYGLSDRYEKVGELSNILVKSNQFDWKYWDGNYAIGMKYNSQAPNAADKLTITLIDKAGNRSPPLELTVNAVTDSFSTDPSTSSTTDLSSTSDTQSSETTTEESSTHENSFSSSKDSSSNSSTSKPSQQKQYNNHPKKNLPETGERTSSTILQIIGLLLLIGPFF